VANLKYLGTTVTRRRMGRWHFGCQYISVTWCEYEGAGMIILCDLMGAMQLDYNKDVCAYFNLQYQFRFQFIDTQLCWSSGISKMSFYVSLQKWVQFLEQWINI